MLTVEELTDEQKERLRVKADEYMKQHALAVNNLIKNSRADVAPSGSDIFRPALWGGRHWRWFLLHRP